MGILKDPQEVEVLYVLPAIRRELAKEMKMLGLEQKQIAKLLKVTGAAISHYINEKRAKELEFDKSLKQKIKQAAENIKNGGSVLDEVQTLRKTARENMLTCRLCRDQIEVPKNCRVCF